MISKFQKYASGRLVLILFCVTICVYLAMLLHFIPSVLEQAPKMKLFDMSPVGYTHAYAKNLLEAIGPEGRRVYLTQQLPLDFIYPGLFAITYTLMLVWLFSKRYDRESKIYFLAMIPLLSGMFDYFENVMIILMLRSFPQLSPGLVRISSIFSIAKSVTTIAFFLLFFYGLSMLALKKKPHA